jgi:N-acyl-D-aspartate/D-glutamate deacylase
MLDLIIRGGDVVDGTGKPRRRADVGVQDGRIVEVGQIEADAGSVVDATGKVVTPGFVDVHTHYDAQAFWDSALSPSPLHGVTTVLAGNCGFSISPLPGDPADRDYLVRMLARVEGMPIEALHEGVDWSWRSTQDYLDSLEGALGVNAGFMVGHSAVRRTVMGPDASSRAATEAEVAAMERLVEESIEAGGIGFSSTWSRTHNDADGGMVPSRHGTREEVLALCRAVGRHPGTSLEFIPSIGPFEPWAIDLMAEMSAQAGRPLNWNVLTVNAANAEQSREKLHPGDVARQRGAKVVALLMPITLGVRLNFQSGFVLDAIPGWEEAMLLPRSEKIALFGDRAARDRLNRAAQDPANPLPMLTNWSTKVIFDVVADENKPYVGRTVGEIASEQGRDAWDVLCDIALADELLTSFGTIPAPDSDEDWKVRCELITDRRTIVGASDAGAHLDLLASFNYTTILLDEAVRKRGLLSVEEAVHLLTDVPARLYGLVDRGRIQTDWKADLVVMDPRTVASDPVAMRYDLPGGAGRLYAGSSGVHHVFVNGTPIVSDGELTTQRGGTILRSGRDTRTPDLD